MVHTVELHLHPHRLSATQRTARLDGRHLGLQPLGHLSDGRRPLPAPLPGERARLSRAGRQVPRRGPHGIRLRQPAVGQRGHHRPLGALPAVRRPRPASRALPLDETLHRLHPSGVHRPADRPHRATSPVGRPGRLAQPGGRPQRQVPHLGVLLHLRPRPDDAHGPCAGPRRRCRALRPALRPAPRVLREDLRGPHHGTHPLLRLQPQAPGPRGEHADLLRPTPGLRRGEGGFQRELLFYQ